METKFLTEFVVPRTVINRRTLKNYGLCKGMSRFSNGDFAIRKNGEVSLFTCYDNLLLQGLANIHVFEYGYKLCQDKTSFLWTFVNRKGFVIEQNALNCRVLGKKFAALEIKPQCWRIYRLDENGELIVPWPEIMADDIAMLYSRFLDVMLAIKNKTGLWELQKQCSLAPKIRQNSQIKDVQSFWETPCGILTADTASGIVSTKGWCIEAQSCGLATYKLWNLHCKIVCETKEAIILLDNGMYFVRFPKNIWNLYTCDNKCLVSGIQTLRTGEGVEYASNLLWGYSVNHVMTFRLFQNGLLHFMCDETNILYAADGTVIEEKAKVDTIVFAE